MTAATELLDHPADRALGESARAGLWTENPGFVQMLGMCPLLAVSTTVVNAASLALATMIAMTASGALVSLLRGTVPRAARIPAFIIVVAVLVTVLQLLLNAYAHRLYQVLGLFIPLIVTNCLVLARIEACAAHRGIVPAALDGLFMAAGLGVALVLVGALREVVAQGTLLSGIDLAFGAPAKAWVLHILPPKSSGYPLAAMPCGAFLGLALFVALRNVISKRRA